MSGNTIICVVQLSMKQVILCRVAHISKPGETLEVGSWSSIVSDEVPLTEDVVLGYMGLFEAHDGSSISVRTSQSPPQELVEENTHIPVLYLIRASLTDDTDLDVE